MINKEEKEFIFSNLDSDLQKLILKKGQLLFSNPNFLFQQINARQKYSKKFPSLINNKNVLFPPQINLEQSSSELTAKNKFQAYSGKLAIDLTGGFGIDSIELSKKFNKVILVETNKDLIEIVQHNLKVLHVNNIEIVNQLSENYINSVETCDLIYLDPDRRSKGNRNIILEDYSPNVINLQELLVQKAKTVLIKISPMYDINEIVRNFKMLSRIIAVSYKNDLKELLIELKNNTTLKLESIELNILSKHSFNYPIKKSINQSELKKYIYVPSVGLNKINASNEIANKYNLNSIAKNVNIYSSEEFIQIDQMRVFEIISINKYTRNNNLIDNKYNIITKNTGLSVKEIKNKLKIVEGGDYYLFLIKNNEGKYILVEAKKSSS